MRPVHLAVVASTGLHIVLFALFFIPSKEPDLIRIDLASRPGGAVGGPSRFDRLLPGAGRQSAKDTSGGDAGATGVVTKSISDLLRTIPYPPAARLQEMQGLVLIIAEVRPDGSVELVRVKSSSGFPLLDQAAVRGVEKWRFPERKASYQLEIPVRFTMRD